MWVAPTARSVAEILRERQNLWKIAKLRVQPRDAIQARAPIFGVPFDLALRKLGTARPNQRLIKSMYQRVDASYLESVQRGIVATMVAHLGFDVGISGPEVTLEAWQVPNVEAETFYLHAVFIVNKGCFVHLDGATMHHDISSKQKLFQRGEKTKGYGKQKYFRLDGEISIEDVRMLAKAFLPLEDLATEYLLTGEDSDVQIVGLRQAPE